jgi:uncharacterized protein YkwD
MKTGFLFFSLSIVFGIMAYDKTAVDTAYRYINKNWSYVNSKGDSIRVVNIKKSCQGNECLLIVNGKSIDPAEIKTDSIPTNIEEKKSEETVSTPIPVSTLSGAEPGRLHGITKAHNTYRKEKGVPDLVWDSTIAAYSLEWANKLKSKGCGMQHRTTHTYGENLAWASGFKLTPVQVVKMWHDEGKDYSYSKNSCAPGKVCGHYTQVMWRNSKKVGCAVATCGNSEVWVCNYDPPGNFNMHINKPY